MAINTAICPDLSRKKTFSKINIILAKGYSINYVNFALQKLQTGRKSTMLAN